MFLKVFRLILIITLVYGCLKSMKMTLVQVPKAFVKPLRGKQRCPVSSGDILTLLPRVQKSLPASLSPVVLVHFHFSHQVFLTKFKGPGYLLQEGKLQTVSLHQHCHVNHLFHQDCTTSRIASDITPSADFMAIFSQL